MGSRPCMFSPACTTRWQNDALFPTLPRQLPSFPSRKHKALQERSCTPPSQREKRLVFLHDGETLAWIKKMNQPNACR
jgi:hypothetical protein